MQPPDTARRLAAVLFTDISGYSRMMGEDEAGTLRKLQRHNDIALPIIAAHGGRLVKTIGDALMVEFAGPEAATRAALAILEALAVDAEGQASPIRIRCGIHFGDVVDRDGDVFGETVNIAARLEPLAEPGGVAVSQAVMRSVGDVPLRSTDCGEVKLKNIQQPVRVFRLRPPGGDAPRPLPKDRSRLWWSAGIFAVATLVAAAFLAGRPPGLRRVVIVPASASAGVDPGLAWALATRLVEGVDHYDQFRPVTPVGTLAARREVLGLSAVIPDDAQALRLAEEVGASTVAAVAVEQLAGGDLRVVTRVFDVEDPESGVSTTERALTMADLDAGAPDLLADDLAGALAQQWGEALSDNDPGRASRSGSFVAFKTYLGALDGCLVGDYQACKTEAQHALEQDPSQPIFHSLLACALSFLDDNEGARAEVDAAQALMIANPPSTHDRLFVEQDSWFVEGSGALDAGDKAGAARWGRKVIANDLTLAQDYHEPRGWFYAAIAAQWLLQDQDLAHEYYTRARADAPSLFPPWFEEAKFLVGGKREADREEAAALLWTYAGCNPGTAQAATAERAAIDWGLQRPAKTGECAGGGR